MLYPALRRNAFHFITSHGLELFTHVSLSLLRIRLLVLSLMLLIFSTSAFATQVTLQWDPNTEPSLAGYKVYYGYSSRQYNTNVNAGNSTKITLSGLDDVKIYYFAVTAYDSNGNESKYSNEVSYDLSTADSDKDGLSDWGEISTYRTNPNKADTDGDGLSDGDEVEVHRTDPARADSDGDGVSDGVEVSKGSNPLDPGSIPVSDGAMVAVNAGGPQYVGTDSTVYKADAGFSGGQTNIKTVAIAGTADDPLYQSWRSGNFSYAFPVANGDYLATLKFAENRWTQVGQRVFNVSMEGKVVLSKLDVFAKVGPNAAYDVTLPVTVSDGVLSISFQPVVGNAMVSGITIEPKEVVLAVNAGGPQYVNTAGEVYDADADFSGGKTYTTTVAIAGTQDDRLYQSERYGNFSYNVPMANGSYDVTLKFAEIYFTSVGQRVFNVSIEGKTVISKLDLVAKVGPKAAYDVTVPVTVSDGMLNIGFQSVINNAKVSAIKVTTR
jgi:Malectin domain/Bacterial TSP3 repeat